MIETPPMTMTDKRKRLSGGETPSLVNCPPGGDGGEPDDCVIAGESADAIYKKIRRVLDLVPDSKLR
jgi:hypothetical protein